MISKLIFWILDYAYAAIWQMRAINRRQPPARHVTSPTKPPVILIPGVYEPWLFMQPIAEVVERAGYSNYYIEELGYHTMRITDAAQAVRRLIDQHHLKHATIVAHSKGGLVGKYLLSHLNHDQAVSRLIAIATPFAGSRYARLWLTETVRSFSPHNSLIRELQANNAVNRQISSIYGHFDPHIPGGSHLPGAINLKLPLSGHFRILNHPLTKQAVLSQLEPTPN